jgi:hypothetical protein
MAKTKLHDTMVDLLVDSGACASFVNPDVYKLLCRFDDVVLHDVECEYDLADGNPLNVYGQFSMPVCLGSFVAEHVFIALKLMTFALGLSMGKSCLM